MTLYGFLIWLEWILFAYWPSLLFYSIVNIFIGYKWLHIGKNYDEVLLFTIFSWLIYCYLKYGYGVG